MHSMCVGWSRSEAYTRAFNGLCYACWAIERDFPFDRSFALLFCYTLFLCTSFFVDSSRCAMDFCWFFFFGVGFGSAFVIARSTCRARTFKFNPSDAYANKIYICSHCIRVAMNAMHFNGCLLRLAVSCSMCVHFGMEKKKLETRQADAIYTKHNDSSFCFDRFFFFFYFV